MEVVSTTGMGVWDSRSKISNTLDVGKEASIFTACYRQPDRTNFAQTVLQRTKMFLENNVPPLEADRANTMSFEFFKFHMCWQPQILQQHDGRFAVRGQKNMFQSAASQPRMKVMLYQNIAPSPSNLCTRVNSMIDIANDMAATTF